MWQLLKIGVGVGVIILFEVIKFYLRATQSSEAYYYFIFNLFSCYQALILSFCIITFLLEEVVLRKIKKNRIIISTGVFILLVIFCEGIFTYLLYSPKNIPAGAFATFKSYYNNYDCKLIQYEPQATVYDENLFYKLRDNHKFRYKNKEFSNTFITNSRGFRDSESALKRPAVVCLGDSYTLGWGAEQREAFPDIIEDVTGLNTLNGGMSSYGTARESSILSAVDTMNLKFIIWQYCSNDDEENLSFINEDFHSKAGSEAYFNSLVELQNWSTAYFPGKHFLTISKMLLPFGKRRILAGQSNYGRNPQKTSREESRAKAIRFLNIVAWSHINYQKTKIIIVELSPEKWSSGFLNEARAVASEGHFKQVFGENIVFADLHKILTTDDYYELDLHLTKVGNLKVGTYLAGIIKQLQGE